MISGNGASMSKSTAQGNIFGSLRYRKNRDRLVEVALLAAGLVAVFTTLAIVGVLLFESASFSGT